jgi:hypothetical protein
VFKWHMCEWKGAVLTCSASLAKLLQLRSNTLYVSMLKRSCSSSYSHTHTHTQTYDFDTKGTRRTPMHPPSHARSLPQSASIIKQQHHITMAINFPHT